MSISKMIFGETTYTSMSARFAVKDGQLTSTRTGNARAAEAQNLFDSLVLVCSTAISEGTPLTTIVQAAAARARAVG